MAHRLRRLLAPDSIAIVGASEREGSLGGSTWTQLRDSGFDGDLYPVNPRYDLLFGQSCFADLSQLPVVPDLVVFAISGLALERSFEEAMSLGVGGAVVYAANHLEQDSTPKLVDRLREKAAAAGIPVIGGNSMGFYNYDDRVFVSFDRPPADRPAGHIGLIVHTGSGMTYMANNDARFCFNYVIASAQEINATVADYIDYLAEQPSTRVIAAVLENVRDLPAFVAALDKARAAAVPVLITPLGRSEQSAQLALSHSGAIVGNQDALAALCQRHGAILCRDMDELIVSAMLFGADFRVGEGGLASMLDSGGMRGQMLDLAEDIGLPFASISDATAAVLRNHLEPHLDAVNPMDGMGDLGRNVEQTYYQCGKALLDDPASALLSFEFEFRDGFSHYPVMFEVAKRLAAYNDKPVLIINSCSFACLSQTAAEMTQQGIPVINGIDLALRAMTNLMAFRDRAEPVDAGALPRFDSELSDRWKGRLAQQAMLDELNSLELLSDFALPVVEFQRADDREALLQAARRYRFPLVLKTAAPGIAHKSDAGGVKLGIADIEALESAYDDLATRLGPEVVLMPSVSAGVEVALGLKHDPRFGSLIVVACGGVLIELLAERSFRMAPFDRPTAEAMIDETRLAKLLAGVRGRPAVDRDALVDLMIRFSALVHQFDGAIAEIDMNPIIVNENGCTIVDALIIPTPST